MPYWKSSDRRLNEPPLVREIEDSTMLIFRVPSKLCKPHDRNRAAARVKTIKTKYYEMKKRNLLLTILIVLTILSCSSEKDEPIGSVVGTYSLISIEPNIALDTDLNGEFVNTELIDYISCSSSMTLNSNGTIDWDYLNISQNLNSETSTYTEIECQKINGGTGQYEINYQGITLNFDSDINVISANLSANLIKVKKNANLVVNIGGQIQLSTVELLYTYEEQ